VFPKYEGLEYFVFWASTNEALGYAARHPHSSGDGLKCRMFFSYVLITHSF